MPHALSAHQPRTASNVVNIAAKKRSMLKRREKGITASASAPNINAKAPRARLPSLCKLGANSLFMNLFDIAPQVSTVATSQARQRFRGSDRFGLASEAALQGSDRFGLASEAALQGSDRFGLASEATLQGSDRFGLASEAALQGSDRFGLASEATLQGSDRFGLASEATLQGSDRFGLASEAALPSA
jgi:hypothetical protein